MNNVCNANCGFCNFARDTFPKEQTQFVGLNEGLDSINILFREGIRYLVFTGGEPTLNPNLIKFVDHAAGLGIKPMVVTNGGLLTPSKIHELADAGLSSLIISVDAATEEIHEKNRGLPGVCNKIKEANKVLKDIGMYSTASVTMSHLVDYNALPDFLTSLGFESVVFSYPLTKLDSNFLGFSDAGLVTHTNESLWQAYEKVKQLKKKFHVVNPTLSLEEMQRFVQDEEQRYPCLAGYRFFFLDWDLNLWRCHFWHEPMCSIYEFDSSKLVRDGCTKFMINCYRDSSLMQNIAVSMQDAYQSIKKGKLLDTAKALIRKGNVDSLRAVMEELPWIMRF
ncbi:MAG: radical SAM protein [Okeania sp. SIO2C9]|uniref:radical SAM protein n=1 Tax=Okeania sp. SIO2C9 TaxID=2607791 RepID=UPI0013C0F8D2|nr:radical SAM protein [Okeania sp. SIO2C9]NEQ72839.1 radical SAM protein [Okeania sp. SIO2C9]